jgi:hypothetical protein
MIVVVFFLLPLGDVWGRKTTGGDAIYSCTMSGGRRRKGEEARDGRRWWLPRPVPGEGGFGEVGGVRGRPRELSGIASRSRGEGGGRLAVAASAGACLPTPLPHVASRVHTFTLVPAAAARGVG